MAGVVRGGHRSEGRRKAVAGAVAAVAAVAIGTGATLVAGGAGRAATTGAGPTGAATTGAGTTGAGTTGAGTTGARHPVRAGGDPGARPAEVPSTASRPPAPPPPPAGAAPAAPPVLAFADRQVTGVAARLGPWALAGRSEVLGPWSDQGLATVAGAGGRAATIVYRGALSVDRTLAAQGWNHVGDPDSWHGWVVDPFQGGPGATAKMFRFTGPGRAGPVTEAVHPLIAGEAANNSFAAVSPDGRWLVSGEWGDETRLLVFPGPAALHPAGGQVPLPLSGVITLDRTVRDVQGCAFASATALVCSTSDPGADLWPVPDQVLRIDLPATGPAGWTPRWTPGKAVGRVSLIGQVPMTGACAGTYEPEGVDVDRATGELRLAVAPPPSCALFTQVYEYRPA